MKRMVLVALAAVAMLPGCAAIVASIDVDEALQVAAQQNVQNVHVATEDKAFVHRDAQAKFKVNFMERLAAVKDGTEAVTLFTQYESGVGALAAAESADMGEYAEMLDNAVLIQELIERRIGIRSSWDTLLGRIPGVETLRATAEMEARKYMSALLAEEGREVIP